MKAINFKYLRLILSGALLGVAIANGFFGVDVAGEVFAGILGAGGAFVAVKFLALA